MKLFYLLLFTGSFLFGQKIISFPADQYSYLGGSVGFYKDFQKILLEKNLKPCENKKELFRAAILIKDDNTATLFDSDKLPENTNNKCSRDLTQEVLKGMNGWIAAKVNGEPRTAGTQYFIYPDAFFENFKEGYTTDELIEIPVFPGGINAFRKEVSKRVDPSDFYTTGKGKVTVTVRFLVNEEGKMEYVTLENSSGLKAYDDMIISAVQSIKKKWTPGKIYGYSFKYRYRMPLSFSSDF